MLGALPFEVFQAIWTLLIGLALLWLTGPWALLFLVIPVVASDLYLGNIHVLLAASIVASLRWPALWAIPLLTKPSCGVGLLWYLARGEWRRLAVAVGVTGVLVLGSAVLAPALWPKWIDYVLGTGVSPDVGSAHFVALPLVLRVPAAVAAGHLGRPHEPALDAAHGIDARAARAVARRPGDARRRLRALTVGPAARLRPPLVNRSEELTSDRAPRAGGASGRPWSKGQRHTAWRGSRDRGRQGATAWPAQPASGNDERRRPERRRSSAPGPGAWRPLPGQPVDAVSSGPWCGPGEVEG